jgi:RING finger/CHY zinc finger protein 1
MEFLAYSKNCTHFSNKTQIYASCCNKFYDCHLCHNEQVTDHKITRKYITKIKCIECCSENEICNKCSFSQAPTTFGKSSGSPSEILDIGRPEEWRYPSPTGSHCTTCNIQFAKNYCTICKIWCSKIESFFHCDICDCCHIGIKENFFHCNTCKICLSNNCKDNHICKYLDKKSNCPICLDKIFNKIDAIKLLDCNHMIHKKCLDEIFKDASLKNKIPQCPICKKSASKYTKYTEKFDKYVLENQMNYYYNKWKSEILCNDCCEKSIVKYHKDYLKCEKCTSYNTVENMIIKNF